MNILAPEDRPEIPSLYHRPIEQLLMNDNHLPIFIPIVCDFLMNFSNIVGIFRLCGNHSMVQDLGVIFNLPECAVPPCASVHDVSSFLKQWLRDLPEPLITPSVLNEFYDPNDEETVLVVISKLNVVRRKILASLFAVLVLVLDQQQINQMGPANLATCFVGSLTQNSNGLTKHFAFTSFFNKAVLYLNDNGNDFMLDITPATQNAVPPTPNVTEREVEVTQSESDNEEKESQNEESQNEESQSSSKKSSSSSKKSKSSSKKSSKSSKKSSRSSKKSNRSSKKSSSSESSSSTTESSSSSDSD